ncbi:MAG: RHS repeat protein, partial [Herbaspirillum sp.]|nr:RHS repeat protein [Herbaspirillum sp.]
LATYPDDPGTVDDLQASARGYDANSNVVEIRETYAPSGDQVTTRTYDVFDRLETVTDRWSNQLRYAYDANGNRTQLTDLAGEVTTYSYDALNRMSTVVTTAGITEYNYYRDSRLKAISYPNGTTASYIYDDSGRVQSIDNRHTGTLVSSFGYTYDRNGNRVEQIETHSGQAPETTTYDYDAADRLTEVVYPEKTTSYTYDGVSNRLTEVERDSAGTLITDKSYGYNLRNQLEAVFGSLDPSGNVTYGYDANGNQISRVEASGVVTDFTFDVLDRLLRVEEDGLPIGTYRYNSQGLRVQKLTAEG